MWFFCFLIGLLSKFCFNYFNCPKLLSEKAKVFSWPYLFSITCLSFLQQPPVLWLEYREKSPLLAFQSFLKPCPLFTFSSGTWALSAHWGHDFWFLWCRTRRCFLYPGFLALGQTFKHHRCFEQMCPRVWSCWAGWNDLCVVRLPSPHQMLMFISSRANISNQYRNWCNTNTRSNVNTGTSTRSDTRTTKGWKAGKSISVPIKHRNHFFPLLITENCPNTTKMKESTVSLYLLEGQWCWLQLETSNTYWNTEEEQF